MLYRYQYIYWGGGDPYFFLYISSSWVKIRLHTENQLPGLTGSALKVFVGWWWWGGGGFHSIMWSPQLRFRLELACYNEEETLYDYNDSLALLSS